MNKTTNRVLSLFIAIIMPLSLLTSCNGNSGDRQESTGTEGKTEQSITASSADINEETESEQNTEESAEKEEIVLDGEHASTIALANTLKNNVTAYFPTGERSNVIYENMNMSLDYALDVTLLQQVTSLKNKAGNPYLENTMDVFVEMENGTRYYAKNSYTDGTPNIYRLGYYYYEMRIEGQTFIEDASKTDAFDVNLTSITGKNDIQLFKHKDGVLYVTNDDDATDPYVSITKKLDVDTSKYTALEITMKADAKTDGKMDVFYIAGKQSGFNSGQRVNISINTDGAFHTYRVPLYSGDDYTGFVKGLRFDVNGVGASYEISSIRFLTIDATGAPTALSLCRTFNVYSDKMHQVIQVAATAETSGIKEIGIQTAISADTVSALVIKDKCEDMHTSLDGVDWATVQYVAFDIKQAGIFGYILPYDGKGGSIRIAMADGAYIIEQIMPPENGTVIPSRTDYNEEKSYYNWVSGGNANDFYMGSRIYTDPSHDFDRFLAEAYCERTPIGADRIQINDTYSDDSAYIGYDSLRGIYRFKSASVRNGFTEHYYSTPNRHYRTNFTVTGDVDRQIYVMTHTTSGQLECAVLLDANDMMIPVPLEVGKNFSEAHGERNLYNLDDATYGEVIFPLQITANEEQEYTVVNLYQNWGNYPLKQLSWIQFHSPYYHLSTGVTETNCVLPWMFTDRVWYNTLPDHRGMSQPLWKDQPQHTYAGEHDWLRYVDSEGNEIRWENVQNTIDSYGPTYADVKMDYVTYDGKMKISYTHTELPQTDENRTFYEMTYEVLEDVTINNFVTDFQFYKVSSNDSTGVYQRVGYLDEQNQSAVVNANHTSTPVKYALGDSCPYFSFFDMDNYSYSNGYGNLSFLIYNSEFIIGGKKAEPGFAIVNCSDTVYLTLNIEEKTTLKAGDRFIINAILLPWGSQHLEDGIIDEESKNYEYTMPLAVGTLYMDKNVRDVRQNTLLNPLEAIALENCQTLESVFVPKVRSTNGESAEFTLTGGYGNVVVRAYGFDSLTVPVIYEKVNGTWQRYEVCSFATDSENGHLYDGYCIHYDGDGTYSYSFVTTMDGENDRTFKIVADENAEPWSKEPAPVKNPDLLTVYLDPEELKTVIAEASSFFESATVSEDGSYVTISPVLNCTYGESYAVLYKAPSTETVSGQYLVLKYRVPKTNAEELKAFDIYLSTKNKNPAKDDSITFTPIQDGEWHVAILDLSKFNHPTFTESGGEYRCQYIRFDLFNKKHAESVKLDIAYIGMDTSLERICQLNQDGFDALSLHTGSLVGTISTSTYETYFDIILSPDASVKLTALPFGSALDSANGVKQAINVGSKEGGPKDALETSVDASLNLSLKGWCIVGGGVEKYVWSADGGITWNDCGNQDSISSAPEKNLGAAKALSTSKGYENVEASLRNASFQSGGGITLDLSAYEGKTVNVILAAIPTNEKDSYCLLYRFKDIRVTAP